MPQLHRLALTFCTIAGLLAGATSEAPAFRAPERPVEAGAAPGSAGFGGPGAASPRGLLSPHRSRLALRTQSLGRAVRATRDGALRLVRSPKARRRALGLTAATAALLAPEAAAAADIGQYGDWLGTQSMALLHTWEQHPRDAATVFAGGVVGGFALARAFGALKAALLGAVVFGGGMLLGDPQQLEQWTRADTHEIVQQARDYAKSVSGDLPTYQAYGQEKLQAAIEWSKQQPGLVLESFKKLWAVQPLHASATLGLGATMNGRLAWSAFGWARGFLFKR